MSPQIEALLKEKRYYVFFADGSWRTCQGDQWKTEEIWKLKPVATGWIGGEFLVRVIRALTERFDAQDRN